MAIIPNTFPQICPDNNDQIFQYLDYIERTRCAGVCKDWHKFIEQDKFWQIGCLGKGNYKQHINTYAVTSYSALAKKYAEFAKQVASEGEFHCVFPFNQNCTVSVHLGYGKDINWASPKPKKHFGCVFMREIPPGNEKELSGMHLTGEESFQIINNLSYTIWKLSLPEEQGAKEFEAQIKKISAQRIEELKTNTLHEKIYELLGGQPLNMTDLFSFYREKF